MESTSPNFRRAASSRGLARHPGRHQLVDRRLQMEIELLVHVARRISAQEARVSTPRRSAIVVAGLARHAGSRRAVMIFPIAPVRSSHVFVSAASCRRPPAVSR